MHKKGKILQRDVQRGHIFVCVVHPSSVCQVCVNSEVRGMYPPAEFVTCASCL